MPVYRTRVQVWGCYAANSWRVHIYCCCRGDEIWKCCPVEVCYSRENQMRAHRNCETKIISRASRQWCEINIRMLPGDYTTKFVSNIYICTNGVTHQMRCCGGLQLPCLLPVLLQGLCLHPIIHISLQPEPSLTDSFQEAVQGCSP